MDINQILSQAANLRQSGRLKEAETQYRYILENRPEQLAGQGEVLFGLGTVLMQQNKIEQAEKYLGQAVLQQPDAPEFLFSLAQVEEKLGRTEQARENYLLAASCAGTDIKYLLPICRKMLFLGLARQAHSFLKATGLATPEVSYCKAQALSILGLWDGVLDLLTSLAEQFPEDGALWREQSQAAGHLRDYATAISSFQKYIDRKQVTAKDLLALADLYLMARKPDDALKSLQAAFECGEDSAEAFLIAGKCARLKGDYDAVKENMAQAIRRRPAFGNAWHLLAEVSHGPEGSGLAEDCLQLEKDKSCTDRDRTMLALAAGQAFEKSERYTDAFAAFERAKTGHKDLLAQRGLVYNHKETEADTDKIIAFHNSVTDYAVAEPSERRPIFIVGMPRTGTTLVERILSCLPGVEAGGENEALEFITHRYKFDRTQGQKPEPALLTPDQLTEMKRHYWRRTPGNTPVITDKMPHNFRHVGLISQIFPEAPVIFMKRDPRDVCLSIYCRLFPDAHLYSLDFDWLAHFYAQSERLKNHWKALFPERVLEFVYEDLVDNPVDKTKELADFCGLSWQPDCLDFHHKQQASYTFSELQVRQPINRSGIGRWQNYQEQLKPLTAALKKYQVL